MLLTVRRCSLSWSRHTSGGLSKITLLLFSSPHPVYLLPHCEWCSVCARARAVEVAEECRGVKPFKLLLWSDRHTARPRSFHRSSLCCIHRSQHARQALPSPLSVAFAVAFTSREADAQTLRQETLRRLRMQPWVQDTPRRFLSPQHGLSHLILWMFFRCSCVFYLRFIWMSYWKSLMHLLFFVLICFPEDNVQWL